jgi:uncharacterized phage-associated protein
MTIDEKIIKSPFQGGLAMSASVLDVAQYIIERIKPLTAIKLQKLVYYCQAWSLAWDDAPLFPEEIEAWANGPVSPILFDKFRGLYNIPDTSKVGDSEAMTSVQRETMDIVLDFYGDKTSHWLVELTHLEEPWKNARTRAKASPGKICHEAITHAEMAEFYSGLSGE